jgi:hypothetical protein
MNITDGFWFSLGQLTVRCIGTAVGLGLGLLACFALADWWESRKNRRERHLPNGKR